MRVFELTMENQKVIFKDIEQAIEDIRGWAEVGDNFYPPSLRMLEMDEAAVDALPEHQGY